MKPRSRPRHRGVTLVELMVSLVIGLVIMLAVSQAYLGASASSRLVETQARMNEDAQTALAVLVQQIKLAGANPLRTDRAAGSVRNPVTATYIVRGCDTGFSNVTSATAIDNLNCAHAAASTGPDALAISYEADPFNTVRNASGEPTDCVGMGLKSTTVSVTTTAGISTNTTMYVASPVYYIDTTNTPRTLSCNNADGLATPQPLIENVVDMQVTYGTASTQSPTYVLGYLRAQEIDDPAGPLSALASAAERWALVRTVRVCILMSSHEAVATSANAAQYRNCNGTMVSNPPDLKLRRAYTTTVLLRNRG